MTPRRSWRDWWSRVSLTSRLSLISAGAVAVAVVAVSGLAWLLVREELSRQLDGQLAADAVTIAAQPSAWRDATLPTVVVRDGRARRDGRDIGPLWQILDAGAQPSGPVTLPVSAAARRVAAGLAPRAVETVSVGGETYRMLVVPAAGGGAVQVALSREPMQETLGRIGLLLLLGSLAGIGAAALIGRRVARAGLAPVQRLTRAVEHVAATSDLRSDIPVRGHDEVARLAGSFNAMLQALRESRTAQQMLVEDAGHELRTPLTSLRTNIELLILADARAGSGRTLSDTDRARLLGDLELQVVELTHLANELVELARGDTGPAEPEVVDLADVVSSAVARTRSRAPTIRVDAQVCSALVLGHPPALERMALNLLDNAVKWSPAGGTVRVEVALTEVGAGPDAPVDASHVVFRVADAGPGIDEQDLPRIFERFYRAPAARAMPGSGLGLAIVAQSVTQHHGTVTAGQSDAGGALVTVVLPLWPETTLAFS